MIAFVFSILVVGTLARPDVSELGYQYQTPFSSYEAPAGSIGSLNQRQYYHVDDRTFHSPPTQFQTPVFEHSAFAKGSFATPTVQSFTGFATPTVQSFPGFATPTVQSFDGGHLHTSTVNLGGGAPTSGLNLGTGISRLNIGGGGGSQASTLTLAGGSGTSGLNTGSAYQTSRINAGDSQISTFGQTGEHGHETELSKHLYFYSAPEEQEIIQPRIHYQSGPAKKNLKIIFIKAPSNAVAGPITIPAPPQNEDKTLVYVLVKKQDEQAEINVEAPQPAPPTKPEVFFIKYRTQKEAHDAISNVQSGGVPQGLLTNANSVEGDQAFIGTIGQDDIVGQNRGDEPSGGLDLRYKGESGSSLSSGGAEGVGHGGYSFNAGGGSAQFSAGGQGTGSAISGGAGNGGYSFKSGGGSAQFDAISGGVGHGDYSFNAGGQSAQIAVGGQETESVGGGSAYSAVGGQGTGSAISRSSVGGYDGFQSTTATPDLGGSLEASSTLASSVAPTVHAVYGPPHTS